MAGFIDRHHTGLQALLFITAMTGLFAVRYVTNHPPDFIPASLQLPLFVALLTALMGWYLYLSAKLRRAARF